MSTPLSVKLGTSTTLPLPCPSTSASRAPMGKVEQLFHRDVPKESALINVPQKKPITWEKIHDRLSSSPHYRSFAFHVGTPASSPDSRLSLTSRQSPATTPFGQSRSNRIGKLSTPSQPDSSSFRKGSSQQEESNFFPSKPGKYSEGALDDQRRRSLLLSSTRSSVSSEESGHGEIIASPTITATYSMITDGDSSITSRSTKAFRRIASPVDQENITPKSRNTTPSENAVNGKPEITFSDKWKEELQFPFDDDENLSS